MKVAVTSKAFAKNKQLVSEILALFPDCRFNHTGRLLEGQELHEFLADRDAAIVAMEKIKPPVLDTLPNLKVIAKFGVGLNNIDLNYCEKANVAVKWTPGVNRYSVAEMTLGFMLMLLRNLYTTSNLLSGGEWHKSGGVSLGGKKIGIVGLGNIGQALVEYLQPFQCEIIACDIDDKHEFCDKYGVRQAGFADVISQCDVVTAHIPLTAETENMFNADVFSQMRTSAIFINTSRGEVVDQDALKGALASGSIAGAAIDVYKSEPPVDLSLLSLPNLICTPHIGGNSVEATLAMGRSAISHLTNFAQAQEYGS